ncbi:MAG: calcium-binding protein [Oscillospiraceae bacterium]
MAKLPLNEWEAVNYFCDNLVPRLRDKLIASIFTDAQFYYEIEKEFDQIGEVLDKIQGGINSSVEITGTLISSVFTAIFDKIAEAVPAVKVAKDSIINAFTELLSKGVNGIFDTAGNLLDQAENIFEVNIQTANNLCNNLFDIYLQNLMARFNLTDEITESISSVTSEVVSENTRLLYTIITNGTTVDDLLSGDQQILSLLDHMLDRTLELCPEISDEIKENIINASADTVIDFSQDAYNSIRETMDNLNSDIQAGIDVSGQLVSMIFDKIIDKISGILPGISDVIQQIANTSESVIISINNLLFDNVNDYLQGMQANKEQRIEHLIHIITGMSLWSVTNLGTDSLLHVPNPTEIINAVKILFDSIAFLNDYSGTYMGNENKENVIYGFDGDDTIFGGSLRDIIYGGKGNDKLHGGEGEDLLSGENGNDKLIGGAGNDELHGGEGDDILYGDDENSSLRSLKSNLVTTNDDILYGDDGNDTLYGDSGNDYLYGNEGNDKLDGGTGTDWLYGGNGNDTYIFGAGYGSDTIEDWGGSSTVKLKNINSDSVTISSLYDSTLVLSVNGTEDKLTINGFKWNQGGYTFEFADGVTGTVNKDTWQLELTYSKDASSPVAATTTTTSEETAIQTNADLLAGIYEDDTASTNLFSEPDTAIISDATETNAVLPNEKSDVISEQTDVQTIILIDAMAGFAAQGNISDTNANLSDTADSTIMNQMLVGTQVQ